MTYVDTEEDRRWRGMAIAMHLYRYLDALTELMRAQSIPITLTGLADYMEMTLAAERCQECPAWDRAAWVFTGWHFDLDRIPEVIRKLSTELGGNGLDKALAKDEHVGLVLMIVTDVLAQEPSACPAA